MADAEFKKHGNYEGPSVTTTQPGPPQYTPWSGYPPSAPPHQQQPMMVANQQMSNNNNIIITTQPGAAGRPPQRDWNSGLCDCFSDMGTCLMGWCCPCCLVCSIAQDLGDSCCNACCLMCCAPVALFGMRTNVRGKENIQGNLCDDYNKTVGCLSLCCYPCTLCQLAREVKHVKSTKGYV